MLFILSAILGIIIGLLLKGDIKKLDGSDLKGIYIPIIAFSIEIVLFTLVRKGIIERGLITYIFYLIQFILISIFAYLNRKNKAVLIITSGFILNGLAIFLNGGAMPVNPDAAVAAGLYPSVDKINVSKEGLYVLQNDKTLFWFLGDIIPIKFIRGYVVSIGDILLCFGLIYYIVKSMKRAD
ncbi:DUF5317 domain-containing protein [Caloramator sp. CAR-1]|uniref:DUF5317 domain-containing protein n=1 Tax=Caloramator sp. CAR-1 TaxID=3062777 RepID=UPI0026E22E67|nr:DUF5317 domain-containing protein [Caloramator sp. CAR-1]MDO6355773.1 DUF5317 domain-containing protein [Caloramator sp. CAR-1]